MQSSAMITDADQRRPLLITSDAELLDDVLRLAAAAGSAVDAVPDAIAGRAFWAAAPCVVIGVDAARPAAAAIKRSRLRRRPGVVLVSRGDDAEVWPWAVEIGAERVFLLPDAEPALVEVLADATEPPSAPATVIATIGGRGGAGASSLAAAIAVTAARGGDRVIFVDADPLGGGADLLFGGEHAGGARWSDLVAARGRIPAGAFRDALPQVADLAVLSWDRPAGSPPAATAALDADVYVGVDVDAGGGADAVAGADLDVGADAEVVANVLDAAARGSDVVVVDLSRRFDAATKVALSAAHLVLVITPAEIRAAAAAARVAAAIRPLASDVRLVVRGPAPGGLRAPDIAAIVGLPLAGELRPEPELASCLERGEAPAARGVGPLARLCERLLADVRARRGDDVVRRLA